MSLTDPQLGRILGVDDVLADTVADLPILSAREIHRGHIFDLRSEEVDLGSAGVVRREFIAHPGAVAVIALDEGDRVALVHQYRHPVRSHLWEIPAGLLDIPGESLATAAARELAEEADLVADQWYTLLDFYTTPGGSNEKIRVFLARSLKPVPAGERFTREAEEAEMELGWVELDRLIDGVLAGRIHNPSTVAAALAAGRARSQGWSPLRPADAPWLS